MRICVNADRDWGAEIRLWRVNQIQGFDRWLEFWDIFTPQPVTPEPVKHQETSSNDVGHCEALKDYCTTNKRQRIIFPA
jgi:hypothetical protein